MTAQPSPTSPPLRVRVFLASPGDVTDERALALNVLERLYYDPFLRGRIVVETVAWDKPGADTPMLATMTPQEAITQQRPKPSECDIVIVVFWSRMGTPLPSEYIKPDGNAYLSGTEWEYLDALQASLKKGRPRVLVYRRTEVPSITLDDPQFRERQDQWQLVKTFFASFHNPDGSIRSGVNEYDTPDAFEKKLTEHLREIVQSLLAEHEAKSRVPTAEEPPDVAKAPERPQVPPLWEGSPFPGLRAFDEDDAPIYFGRGRETDGLIRRLAEGARFISVVGASGSGKSSLVAAGLLPRLKDDAISGSRDWLRVRLTPGELGENPFIALVSGFKPALDRHARKMRDEVKKLAADPGAVDELIGLMLEDQPAWSELLLFVDQFEELFTVVDAKYRGAFSELLAHAAKLPRLRMVATLRADFYHRCLEQPALEEPLHAGSYPVAAPGVGALHEMITRPAALAGLSFEAELPERILDDTGTEPGALPLMAFALERLYNQRSGEGQLTYATYERFGGVRGAISRRAEDIFGDLDDDAKATLASVFRELVEVDATEGGWVATLRRMPLEQVVRTPGAQRLVTAFTEARLLQQGKGEGDMPLVEVAHEALLRNWPRLVDWIQKTGEDLALLRQLRRAAEDWEAQDRSSDLRWPWRRWKQAEGVLQRLRVDLDEPGPSFLAASRWRTWRQIGAFGVVLVVLSLAGWVGLFTYTAADGNVKFAVGVLWERALYRLGRSDLREPEMVEIHPGVEPFPQSFWMGSEADDRYAEDREKPRHEVTFSRSFAIGKYEVTFEEYDYFVQNFGADKPEDYGWGRGRSPVIDVSWKQAGRYAHWLSLVTGKAYRLPTEAEWEYVARAKTETPFWTGDCIHTEQANYDGKYEYHGCGAQTGVYRKKTVPAGSLPANPWGLHEVHGNVWEWVQDCWHKTYKDAPSNGSAWEKKGDGDCGRRVVRGGSWFTTPRILRSAIRFRLDADFLNNNLGFRLAQDL